MALKKFHRTRFGIDADEAYARVMSVTLDYDRLEGHILVYTYASKAARQANRDPVERKVYIARRKGFRGLLDALEVGNARRACYTYLKTREQDFATASDDD